MSRAALALIALLSVPSALAGSSDMYARKELKDLYFGEALYHAYQGEYFDAIARLDAELGQHYGLDERERDSLYYHINEAEFAVGDFELGYRMHHRAGRAIKAVLEGNVDQSVRNEAAYRLARIYFQKSQPVDALHALDRIDGEVPARIRDDVAFLRAQVLMAVGRFADAVKILRDLQHAKGYEGFAQYNLGIALIGEGKAADGHLQLNKVGTSKTADPAAQAIKDKANLVLGTALLENNQPELAKLSLDRVRLKGPFSTRALLASGWADANIGRYDRALVPWTLLVKHGATDKAVQEGLLAVPYAYAKVGAYGNAALLYGGALEAFDRELTKLTASIESVRAGRFLRALLREELKQDKNWIIKLRELPESPETYYLTELMASHDFQESLKNYLDLEELRKKMLHWQTALDAYDELIRVRRDYYRPLLPGIDKQFRVIDSQIRLRLEQRDRLDKRINAMLVAPRPDFLATADERIVREELARLERKIAKAKGPAADAARERIARLKGVVQWRIHTEYDKRLTDAYKNLRQLDAVVAQLKQRYEAFVRTRQAATQSYEGYNDGILRLRTRVSAAQERVQALMARQGHLLEVMAVNELELRQRRLEDYRVKARFALADSYDRAAKAGGAQEVAQ